MRSRDRVICSIGHRQPDRTPRGEICIDDLVVKETLACREVGFEERRRFAKLLGLDIYCVSQSVREANEFPALGDVSFPDLGKWSLDTDLFAFVMLDGPFGWGVNLLGFKKFMTAIAKKNLLYSSVLEKAEELNRQLIPRVCGEGAHGVLIADDIAYQRGLLVNPETLRGGYFSCINSMVDCIKKENVPAFFHSDGNLNEVIGDLIKAGFDGLQCIEENAGMDIREIKCRYGEQLCLWGNLDIGELIPPRSEEEVLAKVRGLVSSVSPGGGYIFGTSSGLAPGIDHELLLGVYSQDF